MAATIMSIMVVSAGAMGLSNARAIGMAGAYTSLAKGYECSFFNAANLGFKSSRSGDVQILGFGLSISNNSFSLSDYNSYTGASLNTADKEELLSKIPSDGLKIAVDGEASTLAFSTGGFAFSVSAIGAADINLGRAPMELLLMGNTMSETIDLDGMYGEGFGLASVNLSYGRRITSIAGKALSVGGTFKYLQGLGYEEVIEADGSMITLPTGFAGEGNVIARTATGGQGYAIDLGAALKINEKYMVGASVFNFLSNMKWNKGTEEHQFNFRFDTLTVANMGNDSIIVSSDTTIEIDPFNSSLPSTIKVGLAKLKGKFLWALDWEQGFRTGAGSSVNPRISAGAEYKILSFLPLRGGFALGGKQATTFAAGFGFDLSLFYLDLGFASYNAIAGTAGKGLNVSMNMGLQF